MSDTTAPTQLPADAKPAESDNTDGGLVRVETEELAASPPKGLFLVGIGASAGGLEALELTFQNLPEDIKELPVAFVVVQHLSPDFKSMMDELLARHTDLAIHRVEDGMRVEAGAIYLIPPKTDMMISDGRLLLSDRDDTRQLSLPIDVFLRSLAQDYGRMAVAVILSGTGTDGSRGVQRVHDAGGLVIAQTEDSARFDGMPRAAIDTGVVDVVAEPTEIGQILAQYIRNPDEEKVIEEFRRRNVSGDDAQSPTSQLFRALQQEYGLDFRHYKPSTITRRIQRRLSMTACRTLQEYAGLVADDVEERRRLYEDLLIGVTRFFRDEPEFDALEREVRRRLTGPWKEGPIRAWVCGCATGEEAYSIAILLHEELTKLGRAPQVKVFASDIDRRSLEFAGQGLYAEASLNGVEPERRDKYFAREADGYRISSEIRKMVVFAPHNILRDAPFTNLHLVTCRNLLIYLNTDAQRKALSLFHFGLRAGGLLFLGSSETPGDLSEDLIAVQKDARLFHKPNDVRLPASLQKLTAPALAGSPLSGMFQSPTRATLPAGQAELFNAYDGLLSEFMPPAVLVDDHGIVLQTFGAGADYLKVSAGRFSSSLLDMVEGDLRLVLSGALQRIRKDAVAVTYGAVETRVHGESAQVEVTVKPIQQRSGRVFSAVVFTSAERKPEFEVTSSAKPMTATAAERIRQLETDLQQTRENLQATVEEVETSNEELQATNEELVASNEELQSTNEELHSVNEELYTVNAEHQRKIEDLIELNADMDNLLASTEVDTIFLDSDLQIRRFTPRSVRVFNFVPSDIGRRFDSFTNTLDVPSLHKDLASVLASGDHAEHEVRLEDGSEHLLRILPYIAGGKVDGLVLTLIDVTTLKQANRKLAEHEQEIRTITDSVPALISFVGPDLRYRFVNRGYAKMWNRSQEAIIGKNVEDLIGPIDFAKALPNIQKALAGETVRYEMLVEHAGPARYWASITYTPKQAQGRVEGFFATIVDISLQKKMELKLREQVQQRDRFLAVLSHELRNPLGAIQAAAEVLRRDEGANETARECSTTICLQVDQVRRLLEDLLDVSRITHDKLQLVRELLDFHGVINEAIGPIRARSEARGQTLTVEGDETCDLLADRSRMLQCVGNLVENAVKYSPDGGEIVVRLESTEAEAVLTVRDNGIGMKAEVAARAFELFSQADESVAHSLGGMGVGLALVRTLVELHGGEVTAESEGPGQGSCFTLRIPRGDREQRLRLTAAEQTPAASGKNGRLRREDGDPMRVVLIDDLDAGRRMLSLWLRTEGAQVIEACDGHSGVRAAQEHLPDITLVDIGLPDFDGYEVCRRLRADDTTKGCRLFAISGYGQAIDVAAAEEAGFDAHLTKPVDLERLVHVLTQTTETPA